MSTSRLSRCFAIGITAGMAAACIALPAFADAPTTVSFQANNPWTQEIGSVDHYNDSHDYSVEVAADKTLQINLVTRDPNVFFRIRNETQDQQLVDTFQTGATTWSTENAAAATYTIHVYVDPAAMQRGEVANYALQIGRYGAADMQPATTTVTFQGNEPWAQVVGSLDSKATAHDYTVAIAAGETLQVNLVSRNPQLHITVEDQANQQKLVDTATTGTSTWSTEVASPATYTIRVYADPAALPPGKQTQYALQIGHYGSAGTQPATAGSAAAAAPSAIPAPAAIPASAGTTSH